MVMIEETVEFITQALQADCDHDRPGKRQRSLEF
jgi:hypothetical protein